jgi:hypothetical protein
LMIASRGCSIVGSGTVSQRMSPLPCHVSALMPTTYVGIWQSNAWRGFAFPSKYSSCRDQSCKFRVRHWVDLLLLEANLDGFSQIDCLIGLAREECSAGITGGCPSGRSLRPHVSLTGIIDRESAIAEFGSNHGAVEPVARRHVHRTVRTVSAEDYEQRNTTCHVATNPHIQTNRPDRLSISRKGMNIGASPKTKPNGAPGPQ